MITGTMRKHTVRSSFPALYLTLATILHCTTCYVGPISTISLSCEPHGEDYAVNMSAVVFGFSRIGMDSAFKVTETRAG